MWRYRPGHDGSKTREIITSLPPAQPESVGNPPPDVPRFPFLVTYEARPVRTKRVKEARDEAKKEIEAYKAGKEQEFKKFESEVRWLAHLSFTHTTAPYDAVLARLLFHYTIPLSVLFLKDGLRLQHSQGNEQAKAEAQKESEARKRDILEAGKKNQDKVVEDLLKAVFEAKPVAPSAALARRRPMLAARWRCLVFVVE